MDQNDTKLYKLTLSLGKAAIIMTSSTVTIHHCPLGKFNQRDVIPEEPSDSSTFPCRQVCGVRGGGWLCREGEKNWWTKGWQCHFYLSFLLAHASDSLVHTETLFSVALVFLQQRKKMTKAACTLWINLLDETNTSVHTAQPLKVKKVCKKHNWCHPGVENITLTSSDEVQLYNQCGF